MWPHSTEQLSGLTPNTMRQNIVLIDFENVQPDSLSALAQDHFRVLVFVGANQNKVPFETAASMQLLGSRAQYVKMSCSGSNALDFHIAYYVGRLASEDPSAYFHIVSGDTGFDPLVEHLRTQKISAGRVKEISEIPALRVTSGKTTADRVELISRRLNDPRITRPRTLKALTSSIASHFQKQLSDEELGAVINGLIQARVISVEGAKITYAAPGTA